MLRIIFEALCSLTFRLRYNLEPNEQWVQDLEKLVLRKHKLEPRLQELVTLLQSNDVSSAREQALKLAQGLIMRDQLIDSIFPIQIGNVPPSIAAQLIKDSYLIPGSYEKSIYDLLNSAAQFHTPRNVWIDAIWIPEGIRIESWDEYVRFVEKKGGKPLSIDQAVQFIAEVPDFAEKNAKIGRFYIPLSTGKILQIRDFRRTPVLDDGDRYPLIGKNLPKGKKQPYWRVHVAAIITSPT